MIRVTLSTGESLQLDAPLSDAMAAADAGPWMELAGRAVRTAHIVAMQDLDPDADPQAGESDEPLDLPFGS